MTLGDKRRNFSLMVSMLVQYANFLGYEVALDYLKRCEECEVGHQYSLHKLGLAVDVNLYLEGRYLRDARHHRELHDFWDLLGGARRIDDDMNHYSIAHTITDEDGNPREMR